MTTFARLIRILARLRSAQRAAAAVEADRPPRASDLAALGIDPRAFAAIGRG